MVLIYISFMARKIEHSKRSGEDRELSLLAMMKYHWIYLGSQCKQLSKDQMHKTTVVKQWTISRGPCSLWEENQTR
jgi:hypothetical protein